MNVAEEAVIQTMVCDYLRLQYPDVVFRSDFAAGAKLSIGQARKHRRLNPWRGYPDLFIARPCGSYHGLFIELKRPGTRIFKKDGEPASDHLAEQLTIGRKLKQEGYAFEICVGFDHAKATIDGYLESARAKQKH